MSSNTTNEANGNDAPQATPPLRSGARGRGSLGRRGASRRSVNATQRPTSTPDDTQVNGDQHDPAAVDELNNSGQDTNTTTSQATKTYNQAHYKNYCSGNFEFPPTPLARKHNVVAWRLTELGKWCTVIVTGKPAVDEYGKIMKDSLGKDLMYWSYEDSLPSSRPVLARESIMVPVAVAPKNASPPPSRKRKAEDLGNTDETKPPVRQKRRTTAPSAPNNGSPDIAVPATLPVVHEESTPNARVAVGHTNTQHIITHDESLAAPHPGTPSVATVPPAYIFRASGRTDEEETADERRKRKGKYVEGRSEPSSTLAPALPIPEPLKVFSSPQPRYSGGIGSYADHLPDCARFTEITEEEDNTADKSGNRRSSAEQHPVPHNQNGIPTPSRGPFAAYSQEVRLDGSIHRPTDKRTYVRSDDDTDSDEEDQRNAKRLRFMNHTEKPMDTSGPGLNASQVHAPEPTVKAEIRAGNACEANLSVKEEEEEHNAPGLPTAAPKPKRSAAPRRRQPFTQARQKAPAPTTPSQASQADVAVAGTSAGAVVPLAPGTMTKAKGGDRAVVRRKAPGGRVETREQKWNREELNEWQDAVTRWKEAKALQKLYEKGEVSAGPTAEELVQPMKPAPCKSMAKISSANTTVSLETTGRDIRKDELVTMAYYHDKAEQMTSSSSQLPQISAIPDDGELNGKKRIKSKGSSRVKLLTSDSQEK